MAHRNRRGLGPSRDRRGGRRLSSRNLQRGWRGGALVGGGRHTPTTAHTRPRRAYVRPNRPADDPPRRPSDMKQFTRKPSWKPWVSGVNGYSWHRVGLIWTA